MLLRLSSLPPLFGRRFLIPLTVVAALSLVNATGQVTSTPLSPGTSNTTTPPQYFDDSGVQQITWTSSSASASTAFRLSGFPCKAGTCGPMLSSFGARIFPWTLLPSSTGAQTGTIASPPGSGMGTSTATFYTQSTVPLYAGGGTS